MSDTIIKLENISKSFKTATKLVDVLKDISLDIQRGEFVMIFGQSGSGKSTLLNIILGLEKPSNGKVIVNNVRIDRTSEDDLGLLRKSKIGIVYQQPYWIKSLDVLGNVAFPLTLKGEDEFIAEEKAADILKKLGLYEWRSFNPSELSSGQQQKVSLARALITNPDIIIADEPTGNLDSQSGRSLTSQFLELSNLGKTVIMVTHNIDNLDYAKRFLYIYDGKILQDTFIEKSNLKEIKSQIISNDTLTKTASTKPATLKVNLGQPQSTFYQVEDSKGFNIFSTVFHSLFVVLATTFLITVKIISRIFRMIPFLPKGVKTKIHIFFNDIGAVFDKRDGNSLRFSAIFNLSYKNLFAKKNRAVITIGGVALGIAFTVFLLSIGYGVENQVVSRVANLQQLKQVDVFPSLGNSIVIDDSAIQSLKEIVGVEEALPSIGIAGNIDYEGSNTDVVVYGVQSNFLPTLDGNLTAGEFFKDNSLIEDKDTIPERKVVVNQSFINLIGISGNPIGRNLKISYSLVNNTLEEDKKSDPITYQISGVIDAGNSPIVYAPISAITALQSQDYSQLRIIAQSQENIKSIRETLNVLGYRTTAIVDTVEQITAFFNVARFVFAVVGLLVLFVASLGMFNTLTVSLFERTREVGLMKSIGMVSEEVRKLFIFESLSMALLGGMFGILIGLFSGMVLSVLISLVAISRGESFINLVYLPISSVMLVIFVAGITGVITGVYPSRRATKISALDALRYE